MPPPRKENTDVTRVSGCLTFTLAEIFSPHPKGQRKAAFTLAEVLITLGIIGVVAAITMPTLVQNYKKKIVTTRLKHFSSVWQQAYLSVCNKNGTSLFFGNLVAKNPQSTLDFYNENFGHFIKTVNVEKSTYGITGALTNGSGFYFWRGGYSSDSDAYTYLVFCPYYNDCKDLAKDKVGSSEGISDGKRYFGFYCNGFPPSYGSNSNREWLLEQCKGEAKGYCTTLIQFDGWEIKDDYPVKL